MLQVLERKPQLAAFTGFRGSLSSLHRAVVQGDEGTCRAIIDILGDYSEKQMSQKKIKFEDTLLYTVLNQRTHRGTTPLMVACEKGHAAIVDMLLEAGANPLELDAYNCRTCLHYAAINGRASCIELLTRDDITIEHHGRRLPLRECLVDDIQVSSAKYIDQRSFGGLTPLHFATVAGSIESVQILLGRGAAIMVKTDGDAFIGDEYLNPGSSPLHVAVLVNNVSIAHAIIQAHAELMSATGQVNSDRGRRPWEGHSRTDIRSMRNSHRKLPYHLARERGRRNLMQLVDPRINADFSLDQVRDAQQGLGAKRLSSICSLVIQKSLLAWLDAYQREKEEKELEMERLEKNGAMSEQPCSAVHSDLPPKRMHNRHKTADIILERISYEHTVSIDDTPKPVAMIRVQSESSLSTALRGKMASLLAQASEYQAGGDSYMIKSDSWDDVEGKDDEFMSKTCSCGGTSEEDFKGRADSLETRECGVCLDANVQVKFHGCGHELCIDCSRSLTLQDKKPPLCPFCRETIVGFTEALV